jgi:DNA-binding GntR family transcriptional regulator
MAAPGIASASVQIGEPHSAQNQRLRPRPLSPLSATEDDRDSEGGQDARRRRLCDNISGSTMREALTRLLGEALVTSEGQRGFRVAHASIEDFRDLTEVRKLIETEALRQAIANGDEAWESQIVATFYRLSKVEERLAEHPAGPLSEFEARNREFHHAQIAACPSRWLYHMIGLLFQQSERYRRIALSKRTIPRDVHAEHRAIFDATLARNAELACQLTMDHIERTLTVLRTTLEPQGLEKSR